MDDLEPLTSSVEQECGDAIAMFGEALVRQIYSKKFDQRKEALENLAEGCASGNRFPHGSAAGAVTSAAVLAAAEPLLLHTMGDTLPAIVSAACDLLLVICADDTATYVSRHQLVIRSFLFYFWSRQTLNIDFDIFPVCFFCQNGAPPAARRRACPTRSCRYS
jgi:hypothetical protein